MERACEGSILILFFLAWWTWCDGILLLPSPASTPRSAANPEDVWILEDDLGNWLAGRETQYTEAMVEGNKVSTAVWWLTMPPVLYRLPPERQPSGASC